MIEKKNIKIYLVLASFFVGPAAVSDGSQPGISRRGLLKCFVGIFAGGFIVRPGSTTRREFTEPVQKDGNEILASIVTVGDGLYNLEYSISKNLSLSGVDLMLAEVRGSELRQKYADHIVKEIPVQNDLVFDVPVSESFDIDGKSFRLESTLRIRLNSDIEPGSQRSVESVEIFHEGTQASILWW